MKKDKILFTVKDICEIAMLCAIAIVLSVFCEIKVGANGGSIGFGMIPLFLILWDVASKGYKNFNLSLFTEVTPSSMDALLANMNGDPIPGGILNGITGSILIVLLAIFFSVPLVSFLLY